MVNEAPEKAIGLMISEYSGDYKRIRYGSFPLRELQEDELLIKIEASVINPADLLFIEGVHGFRRRLPTVLGIEGTGRVIKAGASKEARALLGKRVSCYGPIDEPFGTWASHLITKNYFCFEVPETMSLEAAATILINPLTAIGVVDQIARKKQNGMLLTGAFGSLGLMINRLCQGKNINVINIVKDSLQKQKMLEMKFDNIFEASELAREDNKIKSIVEKLNIQIAFDSVSGETPGQLLKLMPRQSTVYMLGNLSRDFSTINTWHLLFEEKTLCGWFLPDWLRDLDRSRFTAILLEIEGQSKDIFKFNVSARFSMDDGLKAIESYISKMSKGKIILIA